MLKIKAMASAKGKLVVPHGSSVYSYHFAITSDATPFAEFLMMAPQADKIVPMFSPLLVNEPVPVDGHLDVPDTPGFGVEFNPQIKRDRPFVGPAPRR
jgi:L-rhamnonate dehydratase